jgi:hypothetical protein
MLEWRGFLRVAIENIGMAEGLRVLPGQNVGMAASFARGFGGQGRFLTSLTADRPDYSDVRNVEQKGATDAKFSMGARCKGRQKARTP